MVTRKWDVWYKTLRLSWVWGWPGSGWSRQSGAGGCWNGRYTDPERPRWGIIRKDATAGQGQSSSLKALVSLPIKEEWRFSSQVWWPMTSGMDCDWFHILSHEWVAPWSSREIVGGCAQPSPVLEDRPPDPFSPPGRTLAVGTLLLSPWFQADTADAPLQEGLMRE